MRYSNWLKHYATSRKVAGSIPDAVIGFLNLPNPSSRTTAPGSTQPLTEMDTRDLSGGKRRPTDKTDNLTAIQTVQKMWVPRRLTTLWASTACYKDRFTSTFRTLCLNDISCLC
jgi:hypothetical protein